MPHTKAVCKSICMHVNIITTFPDIVQREQLLWARLAQVKAMVSVNEWELAQMHVTQHLCHIIIERDRLLSAFRCETLMDLDGFP